MALPIPLAFLHTSAILFALLAWIPFILLLPLSLSLLIFLTGYKAGVNFLAKVFKSNDLIRPVSGLDISFSADDFFGKPHGALAFVHIIDGKLSTHLLIDRLQKTFSESVNDKGYEKLTTVYPAFWMGYPFWKKTLNKFDIKNHLKVMKLNETCTRLDNLDKLICIWMQEPFVKGIPLWDIRIVPEINLDTPKSPYEKSFWSASKTYSVCSGSEDDKCLSSLVDNKEIEGKGCVEPQIRSILVLKTHHMLGDGNSMLKLLEKVLDIDSGLNPKNDRKRTGSITGMQNSNIFFPVETLNSNSEMKEMFMVHKHKSEEKLSILQDTYHTKEAKNSQIVVKTNESVGKVEHTTTKFAFQREKVADPSKFSNITGTRTSKIIKLWVRVRQSIEQAGSSCLRRMEHVTKKQFLFQLSHSISRVFFTPLALFTLVKEFAIHKDCWFTQKKLSHRLNLATVRIPMVRLNKIRKDLCNPLPHLTRLSFSTPEMSPTKIHLSNVNNGFLQKRNNAFSKILQHQHQKFPLHIIAISALAGALRTLFQEKTENCNQHFSKYSHHYCDNGTKLNGTKVTIPPSSFTKDTSYLASDTVAKGLVPTSVNFVVALPLHERHPGSTKFCNFWTHGIVKVKMDEFNSLRRLHSLNNYYWKMRSQQSPEIYHSLVKFHSVLPEPLLRVIANYNMGATIGVTNLAGSSEPVFIGGKKVLHKYPYFGLQWKHASMTLALFSYNGEMTATVIANESVISTKKDVEKLLHHHFLDELDKLSFNSHVNSVSHLEGNFTSKM